MRYTIRYGDAEKISLIENDTAKSVVQNIYLILGTRVGTVPMYREFGIPQSFVDKPPAVAETIMTAEIYDAIEKFEPRAELIDVQTEYDDTGKMTVVLEVDING